MTNAGGPAKAADEPGREDAHPIDKTLLKSYTLGWKDGADGVRERDVTGLILEGRAVASRSAGGEDSADD